MKHAVRFAQYALVFLALVLLLRGGLPTGAVEAHKYADGVLLPRFSAAMNDWAYQHPQDREGRAWEHCSKLDAADVKRWQLVRATFRELDEALKRAGY